MTAIVYGTWFCDDDCCCTEPYVDRVEPNHKAGFPWISRERLWSGEWRSERDDVEAAQDDSDLADAAWWFGARAE